MFVCLTDKFYFLLSFTKLLYRDDNNNMYVSLSSPGGRTGGDVCRVRLIPVIIIVITFNLLVLLWT